MAMIKAVVPDDNSLQPFFVLHKAQRKPSEKSRRRVESPVKASDNSHLVAADGLELGLQAFRFVWSQIESTIKDVLLNINGDVFDKIVCWVYESFDAIRCSCGAPQPTQATKTYPLLLPASRKQLFTALILTNNMEFVDDIQIFGDLAQHLKSRGCHVANLSSLELSVKSGVGGCLRSLLRQFIIGSIDAADISILASWYSERGKYENPIIVIVDGVERCCGSVLSDFIIMLSELVTKIPIILIMGVTTTIDALRDIVPSNVLQFLSPAKFILESPTKRMDAVIAALLEKYFASFCLGHKVATFLRNYFLLQDGTLISFTRALKMANVQNVILDRPGSILTWLMEKKCFQELSNGDSYLLNEQAMRQTSGFPSDARNNGAEPNGDTSFLDLPEMQRLCNMWSSLVMCLYEALKSQKVTLLDLYCAVLDPQMYKCRIAGYQLELDYNTIMSSSTSCFLGQQSCMRNCRSICQAIRRVRGFPAGELHRLLKIWERLTEGLGEIHEKVKELQHLMTSENSQSLSMDPTNLSNKRTTRRNTNAEKGLTTFNEKVAALIAHMIRAHMQPIESIPLHKVVCFKNVDKLQSALMGDPRRMVQVDLLESQKILKCSCCKRNGSISLASMHDTSVMYSLVQEYGDLINLHDLFQSFKTTIFHSSLRTKNGLKQSPSKKKRKTSNEAQSTSDASIQARFCRAITELQITGLLRMPSKRRSDYVQRAAFGV